MSGPRVIEPWWVYVIRCNDSTLYTGITNNLEKRIAKHNRGKAAKYTRFRWPVKLVYSKQFPSWLYAAREEVRIKHLSKLQKEALVERR